jgi:hypothetical protein
MQWLKPILRNSRVPEQTSPDDICCRLTWLIATLNPPRPCHHRGFYFFNHPKATQNAIQYLAPFARH